MAEKEKSNRPPSGSGIAKAVGLVSGFTGLSRLFGLVRDMLMSFFFGTSLAMSAFVVAFTIPNLFRRLFGEGALSAAFVPVFVKTRTDEGADSGWDMLRKVMSLLAITLTVFVLIGWTVSLVWGVQADLSEKAAMTLPLLNIMLPYMIFICLAALCMGALNACNHFAVPAAAPILLNVTWIAALLVICPHVTGGDLNRIRVVAWAVVVAGVLQFAVQLPVLIKKGFRLKWDTNFADPRVKRMLVLMGPAAIGLAVTQFNVVIDRLLAIWIGDWAPAALFYSERLIYFPLGLFATALGTVLLPVFSTQSSENDEGGMAKTIEGSLRNLLFVMIPAGIGLAVMATPVVALLFQQGEFDATSTWLTSRALRFYAPGLLVFSLAKIFVPAFYAQHDTKTPVKVGIFCVGLNLALNLILVITLPTYWKHAGLASATVLAELVYAVTLGVILHRRIPGVRWGFVGKGVVTFLMMGLVMAGVLLMVMNRFVVNIFPWAKANMAAEVFIPIGFGAAVYFALAFTFRLPESKTIMRVLVRRATRG